MITEIPVSDLTEAKLNGDGVYDVLMRATKEHLDQEFQKNRIKGPEYSTVYLGALENVLTTSVEFLLQKQQAAMQAALLEQQVLLTQAEVEKAQAQVLLVQQQTANALAEHALLIQNADKIAAEIRNLDASTALVTAQTTKVPAEKELLEGQVTLILQQARNALTENDTMLKQQCKLDAEFDVLRSTDLKVAAETTLLTQKSATEKAQTTSLGVDDDSVIGRQKLLYKAQTDGFTRNAEQSAAKIMADSWSVRRTTDEGTQANTTNKLDDATVGRAIQKLLVGVGA